MARIATLLQELGFSRVIGFLDNKQHEVAAALALQFPTFRFFAIPADDVRTRPAKEALPARLGLLSDKNDKIRPEYVAELRGLFAHANEYLAGPA